MRDRLKRPKKSEEAGKSEPAQAPLQPAYYDAADASTPAAPTIFPNPESWKPNRGAAGDRACCDGRLSRSASGSSSAPGRKCRPAPATAAGTRWTWTRRGPGEQELQLVPAPVPPKMPLRLPPAVRNRGCRASNACRRPSFQRHSRSRHWIAGIREEFVVQAPQHHSAFERHAAIAVV